MPEIFRRKKFSYYLGEQRALDDIVVAYTGVPSPTPTPSNTATPSPTGTPTATPNPTSTPTPSITPTLTQTPTTTATNTPTNTGTPTQTPTNTGTPTNTPTPTTTPNALCPQQLILSASSSSYLYGLYNRATTYTGGTFETAWYNFDDNVMNYGTNPDGNDYVAFSINSGSDYTSLYWSSDILGNDGNWTIAYSTGNTLFNGGALISSIILDPNSLVDGILFFPPSGFLTYNGGYINYPASCPTPTPTPSSTATPTLTPTPSAAAFDADAAAYLAAVLAAGGTGITSTVSAATDTLVVSLKSNGLWSLIDALYPFLGGNTAGAKFNIKDPQDTNAAYRMSFNGSWTVDASGATPTTKSSSNYGDSNWNPYGTGGNRQNSHHYYRYINGIYNLACDYAGVSGPYTIMGACAQLEWFDGGSALSNGGVIAGTAGYVQAISKNSSTTASFYRRLAGGSFGLFNSVSSTATQSSNSMYIGTVNGANFPEQMRYATLSYGQGLSSTQIGNLNTIINTFNTTLGRNF